MKTILWSAGFCLVLFSPTARADALDTLIAELRSGSKTASAETSQDIVQRSLAGASAAYHDALANSYLTQVKASIVDEANHGGWPCRSSLIYQPSTRTSVTAALKRRFERTPDAMVAYALICPALYAKDEVLLQRALAYLEVYDAFLHQRAQASLPTFWQPFIASALKRQTPKPAAPLSKDDPFSVLPR